MIERDQFIEGRSAKDDLLAVSGPQPRASSGGWSLGWRDLACGIGGNLEERWLFEATRLGIGGAFHNEIIAVWLSLDNTFWDNWRFFHRLSVLQVAMPAGCRLGTSSTTRRPGWFRAVPRRVVAPLQHRCFAARLGIRRHPAAGNRAGTATVPPAANCGGAQRDVQMIGHDHERKNPPATPAGGFAQVLLEPVAVEVIANDVPDARCRGP